MTEPITLPCELVALDQSVVGRFFSGPISAESKAVSQRTLSRNGVGEAKSQSRIAVIPVVGLLTKYGSDWGVSVQWVTSTVASLAASGTVDAIMLLVDSPGGSTAGIYDCVSAIQAACSSVPVHCYIQDLGASGGFALACGCQRISINEGGMAGSIGTYMVTTDWSGYLKKMDVKVQVIKAGEYKATGAWGTELTDSQKEYLQGIVDSLQTMFLKTVATGRNVTESRAKELADGRIHMGEQARQMGLVDAVCTFEEAMNQLAMAVKPRTQTMSRQSTGLPTKSDREGSRMEPATMEELERAIPKAFGDKASAEDSQWAMKLYKSKPTLQAATEAWNQRLEEKIEAASKELEAKSKGANNGKQAGVSLNAFKSKDESQSSGQESGDPRQDYNSAVLDRMQKGSMTRAEAVTCVNRENPELLKSMTVARCPDRAFHSQIDNHFKQYVS